MKVFKSSNSKEVKIITFLTLLALLLAITTLFLKQSVEINSNLKTIVLLIILTGTFYFYLNSLKEIRLTDNTLILKKNIGSKILDLKNIDSFDRIEFSNLTSTFSSKGLFGFNGSTMDNAITFVNNRKNIVRISYLGQKYLFSVDNPEEFLRDLKNQKSYN